MTESYRIQSISFFIREDECERVRKSGAMIMTLDQIEGVKVSHLHASYTEHLLSALKRSKRPSCTLCLFVDLPCPAQDPSVQCWSSEDKDDGDPPRLWVANSTYPGTAFTRSIGDSGEPLREILEILTGLNPADA